MGEMTDWSIEEELSPNLDLIYSLDLNKREQKRLEKLRQKFIWTDKQGDKHKLADIDDTYLQNIINFLKRKVQEIPPVDEMSIGSEGFELVSNESLIDDYERAIDFLEWEQRQRATESREKSEEPLPPSGYDFYGSLD